jgi:NADH-quinone oxidoreductase subunit L
MTFAHRVLAPFDTSVVDGTVNIVGKGTRGVGGLLRYLQTGAVQHYAVAILLGVVLVLGLVVFG